MLGYQNHVLLEEGLLNGSRPLPHAIVVAKLVLPWIPNLQVPLRGRRLLCTTYLTIAVNELTEPIHKVSPKRIVAA
jgi:hypothetical protein